MQNTIVIGFEDEKGTINLLKNKNKNIFQNKLAIIYLYKQVFLG
jgi:hypothetical protein